MALTPQQVFEAIKILWPETKWIQRVSCTELRTSKPIYINHSCDIDWGDVTQYPPPEPKWRPATKEDACRAIMEGGVKCRVSDYGTDWHPETLTGYDGRSKARWVTSDYRWIRCEVPE